MALALGHIHFPPVEAALPRTGQFESRGRPNAIWARVRPHSALAQLHRKLDQAMVRLGLAPPRRAYFPHITLARLNGPANIAGRYGPCRLTSPPFTFTHMTLFESTLGNEGASYEAVERCTGVIRPVAPLETISRRPIPWLAPIACAARRCGLRVS